MGAQAYTRRSLQGGRFANPPPERGALILGTMISQRVREIGRKLQGRTWASAGHGQRAALRKSHEFCQSWSECKIDERRRGVLTRPNLRRGCRERRKELSRAYVSHATERGLVIQGSSTTVLNGFRVFTAGRPGETAVWFYCGFWTFCVWRYTRYDLCQDRRSKETMLWVLDIPPHVRVVYLLFLALFRRRKSRGCLTFCTWFWSELMFLKTCSQRSMV